MRHLQQTPPWSAVTGHRFGPTPSVSSDRGLDSSDVLLAVTTLSFDIAALELFLPLLVGARLVVASRETAADGAQLRLRLDTSGATVMQGTPATWRLLQEAGWTGTAGLKIWCGGEALLPALGQQLREFGAAVWNLYGPTETTIWSSAYEVTEVDGTGASVSIGRPLANTQLYVLDGQLRLVPVGVLGELYIGGDGLARGYLGQAELTAEKFVPHPFGTAGARMYRTGDLARYLGTGALEYVGRVDQQVKVRGYRIEVGEIEVALNAHEAVREAVVVARAGVDGENRLVAYVVAEPEGVQSRELQQHLSSRLPGYMVPQAFVQLGALPLTPNGKVDRRALPEPELGRAELGGAYVAARTPSEEVLAGIWATVLRLEQVGVYDNFFALGGHSLLATQVMSRVREAFTVEVPVRALFEHPTVSGLTAAVEELRQGGAGLQAPALVAVERSGELVLSYAQQRLWFLDQLEPGSSAYNIPAAVRLQGALDVEALEQSFAEVSRRHESLRTRFAVLAGVPVQVIDEAGEFRLLVTDLSELEEDEREAEAHRVARAEAQQPFDLAVGPLFRARVLRLGAEDHVLLCTMHHIVSDGWSMGLLIKELTSLYEAFTQGQPSPLAELTIQYADFAQWQRGWLQGEVLERQLNYWKQQLGGAPAALELPTDYVRPAVQSFRGAHQPLQLAAELTEALKELSRREGVTLFMTVLAGWQLLLSRYSGQADVVVGTAIAGRNRAETEALIGFFVNTLVLRTDLSGDPSFVGLLGRVREVALGAYAHQDVPFEKLVEELQPERDLSRSPLFQVLLLLQNAPQTATQLRGLELSAVGGAGAGEATTVKYDLTLELTETGGGLVGTLGYNVELFQAETISRMVRHLELLLETVVQQPEQRLSELELVSAGEREQLLVQWNETAAEYAAEQCIHELFEAQVARTPEAMAVVYEGEQVSYRELNERANQLAHYLKSLGVGPEVLVGLCVERSVAMMVGLLGILKAGGAYVPLDPSYPQERLAYMLADAKVPVLLTQEALLPALPPLAVKTFCLDSEWALTEGHSTANPCASATPNNLAYVIYTSGSTGHPKGVQIAQRGVVNLLEAMRHLQRTPPWSAVTGHRFGPTPSVSSDRGLNSDDVLLAVTTLSFDIAALELFLPLLVGARLVVVSRETAADGAQLRLRLDTSGATVMQATPATWRLLQEAGWTGTAGLKIWCGGEALLPALGQQLRELGTEVWNLYGPTETTIWSSAHEVTEVDAAGPSVSIGRPLANTQMYVLDGQLRPVPVGVLGELYIGGDGLARGYLGQAGLTAEKFVPHPFAEGGERLYRTGDLARYLGTGALEYVGRVDQQVKVRGYRIEVGEIEVALNAHKAVREAVVVARAGADGEKRLVAYVVTEGVQSRELQQHLSSRLPGYMVPQAFVQLEALPLTPNGKVDRRALPEPELGRAELGGAYVAARTPSEEVLAGIWATVLRLEQVGVYDNFFALGGHSLLATQVMSRVREAFTVEVPVRALFEHPTVQALAIVIDEAKLSEGGLAVPPIVRVSREEELPLSFAQQRQWILDQLDPGSSAYLIPFAIRLRGQLDVAALERTFSEILNRHETLRTNFELVAGRPVQVVRPAQPLSLRVINLRGHDEREAEARRLVTAEAKRPFDLVRDQLLRVSLLQLEEDHYVLLCTMHHIASDGWSIGVLVKEITTLYKANRAGEPSPLPELTIQYADFAHWQQNWFQGEVLEKQLDYWKRQLDQVPVLLLPTDRPRPAMQSFDGAAQGIVLHKDLTRRIKALSQREGSTLFMVLLATFQTLLSRYARQDDISVGTFIANRNRADIEGLVGFFVNNLTLRTDLSGDPTFSELLRRVRNVTLGAYAHQDLPFEKVLEAVQPDRDLSRTPLFQTMFVLQNAPSEAMEIGDLTFSPLSEGSGARSNFDITLWLSEVNEELVGAFQYSTALFDAATMMRMAAHFQTLIESVLDRPDALLSELSILTDVERRQLSEDWNDTARDYPRDRCLHELFEMQVEKIPNAIAVIFENERLTYAELNKRANRLAHQLIRLGVGPDVRVGICVEPSIEMVVGLFAILKAGAAYVPLDPSYPKERLSFVLDDTDALVLLTQERLLAKLPKHRARLVCIDTDVELLAQKNEENPASGVTSDNMSYVIFTSGSTGTPKGVMVNHKGVVNCLSWLQSNLQLNEQDRWMTKASLSFDASVFEIFWPLMVGSGVVVARPGGGQDSAYVVRTIIEHEVTVIHFVASMLIPFLDQRELAAASSLKHVVCGGEALPLETMQRFYERSTAALINLYGPTEASIACTGWPCERESERLVVPIGRPVSNTQAHVLDRNLRPVPIGVPGELYTGGDGVVRGYLNRPEWTAEKFIPDPFSDKPGARLYKTGDLARYLPDGNIEFLGRIDTQVKVRGFRIELGEVEAALRQHAAVREAVVCAREDTPGDQRLVAYLIAEQDQRPTVSELRLFMKKTLPEYLVPSYFVLLDEFPLNRSGKLDRSALPAPGHDRPELEEGYQAARTPIEDKLAAIWKEVLRVDQVGVHDNFFDLSGHSLQATQMISRAQKAFHVEIPLRVLFDSPTVSGFAERVERLLEDGQSSTLALVPAGRNRESLSYAQQRLWFLDQMTRGSAAYNVPSAIRLRGTLDIPALTRSLNEIVRRHEALRTTFEGGEGEPVQVIARAAALTIPLVELEDASEMQRLIREEAAQAFDLARGPLLRAKLLRVAADDHVLLLTLHHIICDGWSIGVFMGELAALYEAYVSGQQSPLAKLPIQYADYARWQREWLQGEVLERQLSYWKEQLAGAPAVLELPTDRPRPSAQSFRGQQEIVRFSTELSQALNAFSREEGVTLFMTILGAFQTLLFRYSEQDVVVVGSPIANRSRAELEPLIGFFANTLALRTDLSGDPSFRELLGRVKQIALGAYAHQDVPFEKLVEELQPERSLSHSPLFQVMLVLQNAPSSQVQLAGVSLESMPVETAAVKFDLTLLLTEAEQGLEGRLEYNTDLFNAGTIRQLVNHFEVLLESVVSNPEQRLSELQLLSAAERAQLLVEWNHTAAAYPEKSIQELFEEQVQRQPDALAVMYADKRISYGELNERANQLAHYLQALGVGPEVIVGLCLERSVEMMVGLLGILKAGGAYLPLDPSYPRERLAFMLADAEVTVLLTQTHLRDSFAAEAAHFVCLDAAGPMLAGYSVSNPSTTVTGDNLAYVIYTSGSTGRPKGVLIRQRAVTNLGYGLQEAIYQRLGGAGGLRVSVNAPLVFDASVKQVVQLGWGHTLCVIPDEVRGDGEALLAYLEAGQVEVLDATPAQVHLLLTAAGGAELGAMRAVLVGGEAIDESLWALMSGSETQYYNVYGPTECTVDTTSRRVEDCRPSLGQGLGNVDVYLLDQGLKLAPVGMAGEICVGGAGLARGYLQRPELTAEKFIPHPYSTEPGARLYRTGDVARYRSDGALEYVGRVDHQVKVRGYRIELGEVETALLGSAQVREAVVVVRGGGAGQQLVAYVVCAAGAALASAELRAELQGQLPDYMVPNQYVLLERLPLTPSGKVDRRALPAPDNTRPELRNIFAAPQTDTEKQLAAIWEDVLRVERIGIHDNFFDLGGHSLLATQVISRVRNSFQVEIGLRSLFESPTVFGLALLVTQNQDEQTGRLADVIDQIETVDENNLLTKIEELSDEDVALLLSNMLAEAEVMDE
jgi:amino acid adenylation domain-containing protein